MSTSKRGRKRNENLPPNRARDVQRAFRARRAAHLQALEERVELLEDENARLREALGMPQADRPVLGRGPTGKDKIKPFIPQHPNDGFPSSPSEHLSSSTNSSPGSPITVRSTITPQSGGFEAMHWSEPPIVMQEHFESPSPSSMISEEAAHHHHQHHQAQFKQLPSYPLSRALPHPLSSHNHASPPNLPSLYIPPVGQHQFHSPSPTDYSPNYTLAELQEEVPSFAYAHRHASQPPQMMHPRQHYPGQHDQQQAHHHQAQPRQYTPERAHEFYAADAQSTNAAGFGQRRAITESFAIRTTQSSTLAFMGQHHSAASHHHQPGAAIRLPSPPRLAMDVRAHVGQPVAALVE